MRWTTSDFRNMVTTSDWLPHLITASLFFVRPAATIHHLDQPPIHLANRQNSDLPLVVTSYCAETIYPAILTQSGIGPERSGFRLEPGDSLPQSVSADWKGRVWGRTNCTFNLDGSLPRSGQGGAACQSGDCGAFVECQGAVSGLGGPPCIRPTDTPYREILRQPWQNLPMLLPVAKHFTTSP